MYFAWGVWLLRSHIPVPVPVPTIPCFPASRGSALDKILDSREAMEEHFGLCFHSDEPD